MPTQPDGYFAVPTSGTGSPVLVLHAWWGLNDTIKSFCTRLAEAGFMAFAPDLYHGKVAATIPDAEALGKALDSNFERARVEVAAAAAFLNERAGEESHGIAVIGFSLGAYYAVDLAVADPENVRRVVLFYGTGDADISKSKADFLGHFGDNDEYEPRTYADSLEEALRGAERPVTFHRYAGAKHWFFEPDRTEEFDQEAANLAWNRTQEFLALNSR
jgi:carboxymethylenebutenolidase